MGGSIDDAVRSVDSSRVVTTSGNNLVEQFLADRKVKEGFYEKIVEILSKPFYQDAMGAYFEAGEGARKDLDDIIYCFVGYGVDVSSTDHRIDRLIKKVPDEKRKGFLNDIAQLFKDSDERLPLWEELYQLKESLPFDSPIESFTTGVYYGWLCPRTSLFTANLMLELSGKLGDGVYEYVGKKIVQLNRVQPVLAAYGASAILDLAGHFERFGSILDDKDYLDDLFCVSELMGFLDPVIASVYLHTLPFLVAARKEGQSFDFEENPFTVGFSKLCMGLAAHSYQLRESDSRQYRSEENKRRLSSSLLSVQGEHERLERFVLDDYEIGRWFDGESTALKLGFPSNYLTAFAHSIKGRDVFNSEYGLEYAKTGFNLLTAIDPRHIIADKELIGRHYGTLFGHRGILLGEMEGFTDEVLISFFEGCDKVDDYFNEQRREEKISAQESILRKSLYGMVVFNIFKVVGRMADPFPEFYARKLAAEDLTPLEEETLARIFDFVEDYRDHIEDLKTHTYRAIEDQIGSELIDISGMTKYWYQTSDQVKGFVGMAESDESPLTPALEESINSVMENNSGEEISVVDLGCGDGRKSVAIHQLICGEGVASQLYFCDSSDEFLRMAKSHARDKGIRARKKKIDLNYPIENQLEFCDEAPHLYTFLGQTLGNFDGPEKVLSNIASGMDTNDYLILEVDLEKDLENYTQGESMMREYAHILGFKPEDVSYRVVESERGIHIYFDLNNQVELNYQNRKISLAEGTSLLVAKSARFDETRIEQMTKAVGLELVMGEFTVDANKLVGIFHKP